MFVILQRLMTSFVNRLFTVSSFESDFPLVLDVDGEKGKNIVMPEGIRYEKHDRGVVVRRGSGFMRQKLPKDPVVHLLQMFDLNL